MEVPAAPPEGFHTLAQQRQAGVSLSFTHTHTQAQTFLRTGAGLRFRLAIVSAPRWSHQDPESPEAESRSEIFRSCYQRLIGSRLLSWMVKEQSAFCCTFPTNKPIFAVLAGLPDPRLSLNPHFLECGGLGGAPERRCVTDGLTDPPM